MVEKETEAKELPSEDLGISFIPFKDLQDYAVAEEEKDLELVFQKI